MALVILAETPNAGPHNHRYLTGPGGGLNAGRAADLMARFRSAGEAGGRSGHDFVGVSRAVAQRSSGRPAAEVILLVGVDGTRLDAGRRAALRAALADRFADLDRVVGGIDWADDAGLVREVEELRGWIDPAWADLPRPADPAADDRDRPRPTGRKWALVGALVLLIVAVGYFAAGANRNPAAGPADPPALPPRASIAERDLTALLTEWAKADPSAASEAPNVTVGAMAQELCKECGIVRNTEADAIKALAADRRINRILARPTEDHFYALLDDSAGVKDILGGDWLERKPKPHDRRAFRRRLRDAAVAFGRLATAAAALNGKRKGFLPYRSWVEQAAHLEWAKAWEAAATDLPLMLPADRDTLVQLDAFARHASVVRNAPDGVMTGPFSLSETDWEADTIGEALLREAKTKDADWFAGHADQTLDAQKQLADFLRALQKLKDSVSESRPKRRD